MLIISIITWDPIPNKINIKKKSIAQIGAPIRVVTKKANVDNSVPLVNTNE